VNALVMLAYDCVYAIMFRSMLWLNLDRTVANSCCQEVWLEVQVGCGGSGSPAKSHAGTHSLPCGIATQETSQPASPESKVGHVTAPLNA